MIKNVKNFIDANISRIYFVCILITLALIYFPTFFNAPRSDWWESLYFFHSIYANSSSSQWFQILNTDCFGHVTFRPLAHMFLFVQHYFFGSNFIFMHIINFSLYFLNLVLIYHLAMLLNIDRMLTIIYIACFAFLFTHFDIISWTVHSHFILSFSLFLLGFIFYGKFLKTSSIVWILFTSLTFLAAMFLYEAFILWPFGVILFLIATVKGNDLRRKFYKKTYFAIGLTYVFYFITFLLTRFFSFYNDTWSQTSMLLNELSSATLLLKSFMAACFNVAYNGIVVNLAPAFFATARFDVCSSNVRMGGFLDRYESLLFDKNLFTGGAINISTIIVVILVVSIALYLFRRKRFDDLKIYILLLFLLFSFLLTLFHLKFFSNNEYFYNFQQFRYQYVPNALIILTALFFTDRMLKNSGRKTSKRLVYILLLLIITINIFHTLPFIKLEAEQLRPLNEMLIDIRSKINNRQINSDQKLYIDDSIAYALPETCWNPQMHPFMRGTYQWIFNKKEIKFFSDDIKDAFWVVDTNGFKVKSKVDYEQQKSGSK